MHTFHTFEGVPFDHMLDPPFRKIDANDEPAVRTVIFLLRAAWRAAPKLEETSDGAAHERNEADGASAPPSSDVIWAFVRDFSRLASIEQAALLHKEKEDVFSPWRTAVYGLWNHVFFDTANFLWDVNGTTIGHWHVDYAGAHPDEAMGQLVLYHGQKGDAAVRHRFKHNVLVTPAFLDVGVTVSGTRLSMDGSETGYVLEKDLELDTWKDETDNIIWFIRRDVPVDFSIQQAPQEDGEVVERTGVAAVLVYGNLCLEDHPGMGVRDQALA